MADRKGMGQSVDKGESLRLQLKEVAATRVIMYHLERAQTFGAEICKGFAFSTLVHFSCHEKERKSAVTVPDSFILCLLGNETSFFLVYGIDAPE